MTVYIRDAVRTPRGKARPDGGLAQQSPQSLIAALVDALDQRAPGSRQTDTLMLGCVGQIGAQGGNIAMVAKLAAGLPDRAAAQTINAYCASGLVAIGQAAALIETGAIDTALAGGAEMMSAVGFMADKADFYTDRALPRAAQYLPVAVAADRLSTREAITRDAMDAVTATSQARAGAAERDPALTASRIAVAGLASDECVRASLTRDKLDALPAAFAALGSGYTDVLGDEPVAYTHTIAHAPPVCDGAGLAALTGLADGARAKILGYAEVGGDPAASLTAGFAAMEKVLARTGLTLGEIDRIEFMEAFAVVIAKFLRDYDVDPACVNVAGGHLAKGHPMGATGAVLLSTLLDTLDACDGTYGLVVVTGASGVGAAMIVERIA
ncbi:thiolase family protein [Sphingomonas hylomeconis]|uniref:Beta-ketoacyl synthase N-terminal-like domain-containing protein n=1 Tax=Sphingomonas hylomeconis TaxID=1395958 RepID=A0ABV7SVF4_9SPHN|nr:beta-ketoacyl synthase N-terminal-like domain-containing protein [Sphingomonas hylomeconis]